MRLKMNSEGRLVIPVQVRKELKIENEVEAYIENNCFIIKSPTKTPVELIKARLDDEKITTSERKFLKKLLKCLD